MDNENYPQPKLIQLPYGNSIGQTLANKKYPKPVYSRQPYRRFSRHLRVLDIIVSTKGQITQKDLGLKKWWINTNLFGLKLLMITNTLFSQPYGPIPDLIWLRKPDNFNPLSFYKFTNSTLNPTKFTSISFTRKIYLYKVKSFI